MKKLGIFLITLCLAASGSAAWAAEVAFRTSKGEMRISVDTENAPVTAKNFLDYVREGFYDGLIFHRVIPGFVIQGGGFDETMTQRRGRAPIINEAGNGLKNLQYTLSMARTNDPNSATSQFFINLRDNASLDKNAGSAGYAVFGKVTAGMEVVDAIAAVPTTTVQRYKDVPAESIVIESAVIVQE